jgi:hypothetical protein
MSRGLTLRVSGQTVGEDALYAWRQNLSRGYQATSLSQGRAYILDTEQLVDIMHRKQFASYLIITLRRIALGKCRSLLASFASVTASAAKAETMEDAINVQLTDLEFVSPVKLPGCVGIMLRLHLRLKGIEYSHETLEEELRYAPVPSFRFRSCAPDFRYWLGRPVNSNRFFPTALFDSVEN